MEACGVATCSEIFIISWLSLGSLESVYGCGIGIKTHTINDIKYIDTILQWHSICLSVCDSCVEKTLYHYKFKTFEIYGSRGYFAVFE